MKALNQSVLLSSYSMASQVKVAEQRQLIDELKKELELARAGNRPSSSDQIQVHGTPGTPGTRKRHSSQQLVGTAKEPRSFADVANGTRPKQGTSAQAQTQAQPLPKPLPQTNTGTPWSNKHGLIEGIFGVQNKGAIREELEVALESLNGEPFRGTITYLEAKHGIFGECLGLSGVDFENFDGLRFGFKGCPVVVFKLIKAINVDELLPFQNFEFRRTSTRRGVAHADIFSCKIRGLRPPSSLPQNYVPPGSQEDHIDDGTRNITIEGCEYRVTKEALITFLSSYGEVTSDILEVIFKDGSSGGSNRTGSYSVTVKLNKNLPQLAPIMGKRVKFYYRGIQKLCPKCFGLHPLKACHSKKRLWIDYVENFIQMNTSIPIECYGKWIDTIKRIKGQPRLSSYDTLSEDITTGPSQEDLHSNPENFTNDSVPPVEELPSSQVTAQWLENIPDQKHDNSKTLLRGQKVQAANPPVESDFMIPVNESEHREVIQRLTLAGSTEAEAEQIITARKTAFKKATSLYKKSVSKTPKGGQKKTNSIRKLATGPNINNGN